MSQINAIIDALDVLETNVLLGHVRHIDIETLNGLVRKGLLTKLDPEMTKAFGRDHAQTALGRRVTDALHQR
ncbi:hypothetical protein OB2597_18317 [Pseudooceanicola batsensis HTCC2597]|uniref:Uncharacterized protein n=1 Tax=Pseudooceanicola batsensis (strain ATCC BAA-863 / DSM 15984 / KCTC 12145 / HTCC2597) TaxID=252305 RepID=A3U067_PSEBH|nr:hypothetical protein [Pseudooceanicola batsensis]EAQ02698.1 hypothetical protein OB2597_18317 [Pseudooceanicola batsensis HTCC2597]